MALAKSHELINLVALPGFFYFLPKEFYIPFGLGYLIGTFFLSPDLDLKHSKPSRRWGPLRVLWFPYQKGFKHRGVSHAPLLGALFKLLYLLAILLILYYALYHLFGYERFPKIDLLHMLESVAEKEWLFYAILGFIASELMHLLVDILWHLWARV